MNSPEVDPAATCAQPQPKLGSHTKAAARQKVYPLLKFLSPRYYRYYYYQILRHQGGEEYVGRSVFLGIFFGCIIPFGQILLAVLFAHVLKLNKAIAALSTFITNPLTIVILWPLFLTTGANFLPGSLDQPNFRNEALAFLDQASRDWMSGAFWRAQDLRGLVGKILLAFILGGALWGAIFGTGGYLLVKRAIARRRAKLHIKLQSKLESKSH